MHQLSALFAELAIHPSLRESYYLALPLHQVQHSYNTDVPETWDQQILQ